MRVFASGSEGLAAGDEALPLLRMLRRALGVAVVVLARPSRPLLVVGGPRDGAAEDLEPMTGVVETPPLFQVAAAMRQRLTIADLAQNTAHAGTRLTGVAGPLRFFASVPLVSAAGLGLGALCVADGVPWDIDGDAHADLQRQMEDAALVLVPLLAAGAGSAALAQLSFDLVQAQGAARNHASAEQRYKKMYERASALGRIGVWEYDFRNRGVTWTDGVYEIFGLEPGRAVTREMALALYEPASRRELERARQKAIDTCGSFTLEVRIKTPAGIVKWVRLSAEVEAEGGVPVRIFGLKQDVTEERKLLDQLRAHAECDALTGLYNRARFEAALAAHKDGRPCALLLADLDGFKAVNDTHGHAVGDACLVEVARRLRQAFRGAELIARIGGDEFAVVISGRQALAQVRARAEAAVASISAPIRVGERVFGVGVSIGICTKPGGSAPIDLFAGADAAMYAAKNAGRNRVHFHTPSSVGTARRA